MSNKNKNKNKNQQPPDAEKKDEESPEQIREALREKIVQESIALLDVRKSHINDLMKVVEEYVKFEKARKEKADTGD